MRHSSMGCAIVQETPGAAGIAAVLRCRCCCRPDSDAAAHQARNAMAETASSLRSTAQPATDTTRAEGSGLCSRRLGRRENNAVDDPSDIADRPVVSPSFLPPCMATLAWTALSGQHCLKHSAGSAAATLLLSATPGSNKPPGAGALQVQLTDSLVHLQPVDSFEVAAARCLRSSFVPHQWAQVLRASVETFRSETSSAGMHSCCTWTGARWPTIC